MYVRIGNLPNGTQSDEIKQLFERYGTADQVRMVPGGDPDHLAAWVHTPESHAAANVIASRLQGMGWKGRVLSSYVALFTSD